jgi:hypothetical protein
MSYVVCLADGQIRDDQNANKTNPVRDTILKVRKVTFSCEKVQGGRLEDSEHACKTSAIIRDVNVESCFRFQVDHDG